MTLIGAILQKVKSQESIKSKKCFSPPPEIEINKIEKIMCKKKKSSYKYSHVRAMVDSSPPRYDAARLSRRLPEWTGRHRDIILENMRLLFSIKRISLEGGKVDHYWKDFPPGSQQYFRKRIDFLKRIQTDNEILHKIFNTKPRVATTASLNRDWVANKREILNRAQYKFVLFPAVPRELLEDTAFAPQPGIKRTRLHVTVGIRSGATIGSMLLELFDDVCPNTCRLFTELADGDGLGYGYIGTRFFRKVPHLYWSGGDVIFDNGFGCYAQRGRDVPIGAENYHYSHSIPGLLSMRVTTDDEMCGIFNITFKPLPQLDLRNVVFGRVVRPCATYSSIECLGSALSTQPVVEVRATRRRNGKSWIHGVANTNLH